jgi:hypothetical protein
MKKQFVICLVFAALTLAFSQFTSVVAIDQTSRSIETDATDLFDKPLCLPEFYVDDPLDCLPYGA